MKIHKINILRICNLSHPNFGIFASFLDGLNKNHEYIEVPEHIEYVICNECGRAYPKDVNICVVCDFISKHKVLGCKHTWTVQKERNNCIKCGIFEDLVINTQPIDKNIE